MEKTIQVDISFDQFKHNLNDVAKNYDPDSLTSFYPYFDFNNVQLEKNHLIVKKYIKPFDYGSPYNGLSGTIKSNIKEENGKLIFHSNFYTSTDILDFFKYAFGLAIGLTFLVILSYNFSFLYLIIFVVSEVLLFGIITLLKKNVAVNLINYHDKLIRYIAEITPANMA